MNRAQIPEPKCIGATGAVPQTGFLHEKASTTHPANAGAALRL
jgi:hypothetical protein